MENGIQIHGTSSAKVCNYNPLNFYGLIINFQTTLSLILANCGPPSSPTNGYILPYLSTLEGATVTVICQDQGLQAVFEFEGNLTKSVCNHEGIWEPDPSDFCQVMTMTGKLIHHYLI